MEAGYSPTLDQLRADLEAAPITAEQGKEALLNVLTRLEEIEGSIRGSDRHDAFAEAYAGLHDAVIDELSAPVAEAREPRADTEQLTHAVQCRRMQGDCGLGWETIAAFNSEPVARWYAEECRRDKDKITLPLEYRVVQTRRAP